MSNRLNNITGQYPYNRSKNNQFNLDEYQKQEIYRQGGDVSYQTATANARAETDTTSTQPVGFLDTAVFFDTAFLTVPSNLANGELVFNVSAVNDGRDISNIIELNITPFYFQIPIQSASQPNFFFYRRVFLNITGFPSAQSVRAAGGNLYQFEFEVVNINSLAVQLVPIRPSFYLQSILSSMNEVRMNFSCGPNFTPIPLLKTKILVQMTEGSTPNPPFNPTPTGFGINPIQFTILNGDLTSLLYDIPQPVVYPFTPPSPGIALYFTGFIPIVAINSTQGIYATRIINATTFEVSGVDGSAIVMPFNVADIQASVVIAKNRIAMSMRFTSVANKATNYITVTKS